MKPCTLHKARYLGYQAAPVAYSSPWASVESMSNFRPGEEGESAPHPTSLLPLCLLSQYPLSHPPYVLHKTLTGLA
jgi:hypothetical protein